MSKSKDERQKDLFRPALDSIIDTNHLLVLLVQRIDWTFLERKLGSVSRTGPAALAGAAERRPDGSQDMDGLSDKAVCTRFLDSPAGCTTKV